MTKIDKTRTRTYTTKHGQRVVCIPLGDNKFSLEYIDDKNRVVKCRELPLRTVQDIAILGKWEETK